MQTSMKGLDKAKLLQLVMEGPNVNWNVLNILDDNLESENFLKTLNIVAASIMLMGHSKMDFKNVHGR